MANEDIKKTYAQIFEKIKTYPQIQGCNEGRLYNTILIILNNNRVETQEICDHFSIKPLADLDTAFEIITQMNELSIGKLPIDRIVVNGLTQKNQYFIGEDEKMEWIILAACILIGFYYSRNWLRSSKRRNLNQQEVEATKTLTALSDRVTAALCLVVPANVAVSFSADSTINTDELTYLIDNASYLRCTHPREADLSENQLAMTDAVIPPNSEREVYVRVEIDNGQDMIGNTIPYTLKTNLPSHAQCRVKQLACLMNLSGLETFTCI